MRQLLSDVAVLQLSTEPAGSYGAKVFADLGADVVKVEPPDGDPERQHPERFVHMNTNKRALVVPTDDAGAARILELLGAVDIVIESAGEGDLQQFGVSHDGARPVPRLRGRDDQRVRDDRSVPGLPVVRPGGPAGGVGDVPAGPLPRRAREGAPGRGVVLDRAHRGPGRSRRRDAGRGPRGGRARRLRGLRGTGRHSGARVSLPRVGVRRPRTVDAVEPRRRHAAAGRGVPLRRRLRVHDVDPAAAQGDAVGARRRRAHRGLLAPDAFSNPESKEVLDTALYPWLFEHTRAEATALRRQASGPWRASTARPRCSRPITSTNAASGSTATTRPSVASCSPDPRTATPRAAGSSTDPRRPRRRPTPRSGWHALAPAPSTGAQRRRPAAPRDPRPRLHDGVVGPVPTQLLADLGAEVIRVENPSVFPPTTKGYLPRPSDTMLLGSLLSMYAPASRRPTRTGRTTVTRDEQLHRPQQALVTLDPRGGRRRRAAHAVGRALGRVRREPQDVDVAPDRDPREPAPGAQPAHARAAYPTRGTDRRLGRLHGLRRGVRRPERLRPPDRSPRQRDGRDPTDDVHGRRHRPGRRVRGVAVFA